MEKTAGPPLFSAPADGDSLSDGATAGVSAGLGASSAFSSFPSRGRVPPADSAPQPGFVAAWGMRRTGPGASPAAAHAPISAPAPCRVARLCVTTDVFQFCSFTARGRPVRLWPSRTQTATVSFGARRQRETERERGAWTSEVVESSSRHEDPKPRDTQ